MGQKLIKVQGVEIKIIAEKEENFICLTDVAKKFNPRSEIVIQNWMRNRNTLEFLAVWEQLNNPSFNHIEFDVIKKTGRLEFICDFY